MECSLAMRFYPGKPSRQPEKRQKNIFNFAILLLLLPAVPSLFPSSLFATTPRTTKPANPTQDELARRLKAAGDARASHDQAAVEVANQLLIAQAFREMARLRLMEGDYQQSI